jgi:adenine-specific DNA-methyltransferase
MRGKRLAGFRFRRQHPVGPFIADFYCASARLIVEQDGAQHFSEEEMYRDASRTKWLEARGYRVIRVTNLEVMKHPLNVTEAIHRALLSPPSARQTSRPAPDSFGEARRARRGGP